MDLALLWEYSTELANRSPGHWEYSTELANRNPCPLRRLDSHGEEEPNKTPEVLLREPSGERVNGRLK